MNKKQIVLHSLDFKSLNIYECFITKMLQTTNVKHNVFHLPVKKKRLTLLKSPHVYKSSREQFEIKSYKTLICISEDIFLTRNLSLLLLNKPKHIHLRIKIL